MILFSCYYDQLGKKKKYGDLVQNTETVIDLTCIV